MNILEKIILAKRAELKSILMGTDFKQIEELAFNTPIPKSFFGALRKSGPSIIAEFKRKSPSKGILNKDAGIEKIVPGYSNAGASAISVLTDIHFAGNSDDLKKAVSLAGIPVLRKDFIIDPFQVFEAKVLGASAILLIASVLSRKEIEDLTALAHSLHLDVLLELHLDEELDKIGSANNIIGINNRNLSTFVVDVEQSLKLSEKLPDDIIKVSESGLDNPVNVLKLFHSGFDAFLIGEAFMKKSDPSHAAKDFIELLNTGLNEN